MGGFGSGRRAGSARRTVERCDALDVRLLARLGHLEALTLGLWRWPEDDGVTSFMRLRGLGDGLELCWPAQPHTDTTEEVRQVVRVARVPCHLGGSRVYFVCPGMADSVACARRVLRLYRVERGFLCRHCHRLGHASQAKGRWPRALQAAAKARARLGGPVTRGSPLPARPKGMRWRTYDRLLNAVRVADARADDAFLESADRLIARLKKASERLHGKASAAPLAKPAAVLFGNPPALGLPVERAREPA